MAAGTFNPRKLLPLGFIAAIVVSLLYVLLAPSGTKHRLTLDEAYGRESSPYPALILFGDSITSRIAQRVSGELHPRLTEHCERKCDVVIRGEDSRMPGQKRIALKVLLFLFLGRVLGLQYDQRQGYCATAVPCRLKNVSLLHDCVVWDQ